MSDPHGPDEAALIAEWDAVTLDADGSDIGPVIIAGRKLRAALKASASPGWQRSRQSRCKCGVLASVSHYCSTLDHAWVSALQAPPESVR
jgi:hypothetical protein